jgi:hypothetical protein
MGEWLNDWCDYMFNSIHTQPFCINWAFVFAAFHYPNNLIFINCVDPLLLLRLYRSIIEPLLTYCSICYYPALSVKNRNRLLKISHVSAKIIGTPKLSEIIDHAIVKKARAVATESDHPLSTFFHVLPSQRRYRCIKCKTSRYSRSFVPAAIRMLNAK